MSKSTFWMYQEFKKNGSGSIRKCENTPDEKIIPDKILPDKILHEEIMEYCDFIYKNSQGYFPDQIM